MSKDAKKVDAPKVGVVATEAILAGRSNKDALAEVKKVFPNGKTTMASINWYRNKLRGDGAKLKSTNKPVPTAREMAAAAKGPAAKKPAKKPAKKAAGDPLA